jgi:hypothetical protein
VRVEFCEADVLAAFAAWRRAVGVGMAGDADGASPATDAPGSAPDPAAEPAAEARSSRTPSLVAHLDRAMQRLTQCVLDPSVPPAARTAIDQTLEALDALRMGSRGARGEARAAIAGELARLDAALGARLLAVLPPADLEGLARAARNEVAPFAARMAPADVAAAEDAARLRLLKDRFRLPDLCLS